MSKEIERRYISSPLRTELRAEGDGETKTEVIEGIAAKVNDRTLIGSEKWGFYERIEPGAFDDVLKDDIRCLFNHDSSLILSRTKSGTLEVFVDEDGNLAYRSQIPNRSYALDLKDALESGDVDGSSFAFYVDEVKWRFADENDDLDLDERTITKFSRILDVSPVTYPAYPNASSGIIKRSLDEWQAMKTERANNLNQEEIKKTAFHDEAQIRYKYNKNNS